jgi:hypothetical protein
MKISNHLIKIGIITIGLVLINVTFSLIADNFNFSSKNSELISGIFLPAITIIILLFQRTSYFMRVSWINIYFLLLACTAFIFENEFTIYGQFSHIYLFALFFVLLIISGIRILLINH